MNCVARMAFAFVVLSIMSSTASRVVAMERSAGHQELPSTKEALEENTGCFDEQTTSQSETTAAAGNGADTLRITTLSFMLLRVVLSVRSIGEKSTGFIWQGLVFACMTRCIADDVSVIPDSLAALSQLLLICFREYVHLFGLRMILTRMPQEWHGD
eukprot:TRINITY_DN41391_c0_g1_i1.p1 TRINITY_DN41391_c0_g1~~TRINITY_DN41391_c0_g1_i1.p1  ORF type:complete len:157 (+),score=34.11 TRINITY_DN41391_c0_g1_i1:73-543(+)